MRSGPLAAGVALVVAVVALLLVPVGLWHPVTALPIVLVGVAVLWRFSALVPPAPVRGADGVSPTPAWATLACLGVATAHAAWAVATHAEHVVLRRDAGSYALYTQWIATRGRLPVDAHLEAFGGVQALADPALSLASPAFYQVVHGSGAGQSVDVVPQFLLGTPAVLSLGHWTAGWTGLLIVPALLSGLAVLAAGGLTARLVGARWAPVAALALALSQPVLHAARSTYSEPLALLLVMAAGSLLVDAVVVWSPPGSRAAGHPPDSDASSSARHLALAAGLVAGLAGLVRVDALREVALLLPVWALLELRGHPGARHLLLGVGAGTAVSAAGALGLSRPYLGSIAASLVPLLAATVLLGVLSLLVVRRHRRGGTDRLRALVAWRRAPALAGAAVGAVGLLLATRPLWQVARQSPDDPGARYVALLQARQGLPVDGPRTYAEHSVQWVTWWTGPVAAVLALVVFGLLAAAAVRWGRTTGTGTPGWLGPGLVALGSLTLTLYRPGITPDHPWADRRLVPLVLPAVLVAATAAVAAAARWGSRRRSRLAGGALGAVGIAALTVPPLLATLPVATQRTETGEVRAVRAVCAALGPRDVVIAVDSRGRNEWPQVIRGECRRPAAVVATWRDPDLSTAVPRLAGRVLAAGRRPVLLDASGPERLEALGLLPRRVVSVRTREDQRLLVRRPDGESPLAVEVWLAAWPPGGGPAGDGDGQGSLAGR